MFGDMFPQTHGFVTMPVTSGKHVSKYKLMRKLILVFLGKFENRGIKISRVNSIRITKSINLL